MRFINRAFVLMLSLSTLVSPGYAADDDQAVRAAEERWFSATAKGEIDMATIESLLSTKAFVGNCGHCGPGGNVLGKEAVLVRYRWIARHGTPRKDILPTGSQKIESVLVVGDTAFVFKTFYSPINILHPGLMDVVTESSTLIAGQTVLWTREKGSWKRLTDIRGPSIEIPSAAKR